MYSIVSLLDEAIQAMAEPRLEQHLGRRCRRQIAREFGADPAVLKVFRVASPEFCRETLD